MEQGPVADAVITAAGNAILQATAYAQNAAHGLRGPTATHSHPQQVHAQSGGDSAAAAGGWAGLTPEQLAAAEADAAAAAAASPAPRARKQHPCQICRAVNVTHVLVPCGHSAMCRGCRDKETAGGDADASKGERNDNDATRRPHLALHCPVCMTPVDVKGAMSAGNDNDGDDDPVTVTVAETAVANGWMPAWDGGLVPADNANVLKLYGLKPDGHGGACPIDAAGAADDNGNDATDTDRTSRGDVAAWRVESNPDWLELYGSSTFMGTAVQGAWSVFRSDASGQYYYVEVASGDHTWECPPDVAAELKGKADAAAMDAYAYEGLGPDFETTGPWVPPSVPRALAYRESEVFMGGRGRCWGFRDDDFAQLGVGVALYFRTLRSLALVFGMLAVLALPSWCFYAAGSRMTGSIPDPMKMARLSLGNVGPLAYDKILTIITARDKATSSSSSTNSSSSSTNSSSATTTDPYALWSDPELLHLPYFVLPLPGGDDTGDDGGLSDPDMAQAASDLGVTIPDHDSNDLIVDGTTAAYAITAFDIGSMLVLLIAIAVIRGDSDRFTAYAERKKVSAADYTVFVRGLPADVTVAEIRDHFSRLFALDGTGADAGGRYDAARAIRKAAELDAAASPGGGGGGGMGATRRGIGRGAAAQQHAPPKVTTIAPTATSSTSRDEAVAVVTAVATTGLPSASSAGDALSPPASSPGLRLPQPSPDPEPSPSQTAAPGSLAAMLSQMGGASFLSLPMLAMLTGQQQAVPSDPRVLKNAAVLAKRNVDSRRKKGIITDADGDVSFTHRMDALGRGVVMDLRHNGDTQFVESWVADVHVVRPVNALLGAYLSAERLATKLREARAKVKMWSDGTPHPKGPNDRKRDAALAQVDKLGAELSSLRATLRSTKSSLSDLESTCVGSCFITFNCEESLQRCLRAYRGSSSVVLRPFQSPHLRLRCPAAPGFHALPGQSVDVDEHGRIADWGAWKGDARSRGGRGYALIVKQAPDPSDVIHENLAVTSASRCCRQTITGIVTALLVAVGLAIMIVAQSYSKLLQSAIPDLTMCTEELPALYLGGYSNVTAARYAIGQGYGQGGSLEEVQLTVVGRSSAKSRRLVMGAEVDAAAADGGGAGSDYGSWSPSSSFSSSLSAVPGGAGAARASVSADYLALQRTHLRNAAAASGAGAVAGSRRLSSTSSSSSPASGDASAAPRRSLTLRALSVVSGAISFSASSTSSSSSSSTSLGKATLSRLSDTAARNAEDDACGAGGDGDRFSVGYRYDWSDIPVDQQYLYTPFLSVHNSTGGANASKVSGAGSGKAFDFGTAVHYPASYPSTPWSTACVLSTLHARITAVDPTLAGWTGVAGSVPLPTDPICPDPRVLGMGVGSASTTSYGFCPCAVGDSEAQCRTLPCFKPDQDDGSTHTCKTFTAATVAGCYCVDALNSYVDDMGAVKGFFAFADSEADACSSFIESYVQAQGLIVVSAAAASVVNVLLGLVIPALTSLEGHASLSAKSRALAIKVASAQTINTGLTALLVNARLPHGVTYTLPGIVSQVGLFNGDFDDFNTAWYGTVGTTICMTAFINALLPPLLMSIEYLSDVCARRGAVRSVGSVVTQSAMNEFFVGARFETPRRYPLIITMAVVSIVYSAGFPLLLPLAGLGFMLQYSVDKVMLLTFYRKPPAYDASMTRLLLSILPLAVLAHCGFALWMLSTPESLPSGMLTAAVIESIASQLGLSTDTGDAAGSFLTRYTEMAGSYDAIGLLPRLLRLNTFPYFVLFVLLLVGLTLSSVLSTLWYGFVALLRALTCGFICCSKARTVKVKIPKLKLQSLGGKASARVAPADAAAEPPTPATVAAAAAHAELAALITAALHEFKTHAAAYSRLPVVTAGLLFEALFVRTVKADPPSPASSPSPAVGGAGGASPGASSSNSSNALQLDGESTGDGKGLSPFTAQFSRIHDHKHAGTSLSSAEIKAGWRLQVVDARTLDDVNGHIAHHDHRVLLAAVDAGVAPKGTAQLVEACKMREAVASQGDGGGDGIGAGDYKGQSQRHFSGSAGVGGHQLANSATTPYASVGSGFAPASSVPSHPTLLSKSSTTSSSRYPAASLRLLPAQALAQVAAVTGGAGSGFLVASGDHGQHHHSVNSADRADTETGGAHHADDASAGDHDGGGAGLSAVMASYGRLAGKTNDDQLRQEDEAAAAEAAAMAAQEAADAEAGGVSATSAGAASVPQWGDQNHAIVIASQPTPSPAAASVTSATSSAGNKPGSKTMKHKKKGRRGDGPPTIYYLRKLDLHAQSRAKTPAASAADSSSEPATVNGAVGSPSLASTPAASVPPMARQGSVKVTDLMTPGSGHTGAGAGGAGAKLTWEVIKDSGLHSYDVRKNPFYTAAFVIAREGDKEDDEDEVLAAEQAAEAEAAALAEARAITGLGAALPGVGDGASPRSQQADGEQVPSDAGSPLARDSRVDDRLGGSQSDEGKPLRVMSVDE